MRAFFDALYEFYLQLSIWHFVLITFLFVGALVGGCALTILLEDNAMEKGVRWLFIKLIIILALMICVFFCFIFFYVLIMAYLS